MKSLLQFILRPFRREGTWSRTILLILLVILVAAGALGYLDPLIKFLNSPELTLKIEQVEITPYRAIKIIVFISLFLMLSATLLRAIDRQLTRVHSLNSSNRELIVKALQILSIFIIFIVTLDILHIDLTALAVFGGAIGIGLGFGLQKIASNFISGIILLMEKSIRLDDVIELPDGTWGSVRKIGGRYTLIESLESTELMVPNEDFITGKVVNWTFTNTRARVTIPVGVSYGSDLDVVKQCIFEAATEHPRCSSYPEASVYLREFGDSSVNFVLFFWIDDVRQGRYPVQSDVMFAIWHKFKEKGIEIPFPQRDLHIRSGLPQNLAAPEKPSETATSGNDGKTGETQSPSG
ncbi:MAG TPA: mechanosensitive ion channel domain-containing protein [Alphaproteobacteria bacterium]|nr:mechanosensitive ion channel domain-containing protein [Alphaproteobacteria bacterium]